MKIAIASDHAGFELKEKIRIELVESGFELKDFGCYSTEAVDYPDYAHLVAKVVSEKEFDKGILVCGSGTGMAITANKTKEIRAANCWDAEIAELAREHNDINILCLGARVLNRETATEIVSVFLETKFAGQRHLNRILKIE